jgi:hypothetical protein
MFQRSRTKIIKRFQRLRSEGGPVTLRLPKDDYFLRKFVWQSNFNYSRYSLYINGEFDSIDVSSYSPGDVFGRYLGAPIYLVDIKNGEVVDG